MSSKEHVFVRIGEAATRSGVGVETIRYYERAGLLPRPRRTENRYRLYSASDIGRLSFIRRCRQLGFPLDEIRSLMALADDSKRSCGQVKTVVEQHLGHVRVRLSQLRRMEATLKRLVRSCEGGGSPDCSILKTLQKD